MGCGACGHKYPGGGSGSTRPAIVPQSGRYRISFPKQKPKPTAGESPPPAVAPLTSVGGKPVVG